MSEYFALCQSALLCFVRITGIVLSLILAVFSSYFQTKVSPVRSIVDFKQCFIFSRPSNMVVYWELRVTATSITEPKFSGCLGAWLITKASSFACLQEGRVSAFARYRTLDVCSLATSTEWATPNHFTDLIKLNNLAIVRGVQELWQVRSASRFACHDFLTESPPPRKISSSQLAEISQNVQKTLYLFNYF
jgi:hypothetical protein